MPGGVLRGQPVRACEHPKVNIIESIICDGFSKPAGGIMRYGSYQWQRPRKRTRWSAVRLGGNHRPNPLQKTLVGNKGADVSGGLPLPDADVRIRNLQASKDEEKAVWVAVVVCHLWMPRREPKSNRKQKYQTN
uniref:Uncharacterized protein n=1 Tax=Melanopsichium pennsylvanicum 4 TaxID=1398559 RepID=A0A077RCH8_9BASI|nr:uncharacterized protein BN887_06189 [Melanopsichium pennsylvanicum 4]